MTSSGQECDHSNFVKMIVLRVLPSKNDVGLNFCDPISGIKSLHCIVISTDLEILGYKLYEICYIQQKSPFATPVYKMCKALVFQAR